MLLSLQIGFSFERAAVACAVLERTSGFGPSSDTIVSRYLKPVIVPSFLSLYHDIPPDAIGAVRHQFGLLSIDLNLIPCAAFVETFS